MSTAALAVLCTISALVLAIGVLALVLLKDEKTLEQEHAKRRQRQSVVPADTDYIDEHQSDDAPEFRSVERDPLGNLKFRRY